jgi:hypothetical protein
VAAALAFAVDLFGAPADHATKFPIYMALLADIPHDLLAYGVVAACRDDCTFFPRPAQIRAPIREELARRNMVVRRLETALSLARRAEERRRAS